MTRTIAGIAAALFCALLIAAQGGQNPSLEPCLKDSDPAGPTILSSAPCGTYGILTTRKENVGGVEIDVTVKYMVHVPAAPPKALVVLFSGKAGDTGIQGDPGTGQVTAEGTNFLVRSAAIFAAHGYLTLTIDRPSTGSADVSTYDQYRISARAAEDIVRVIARVNFAGLDVLLAGTSRGAITVTAQHRLGVGSLLSSAVSSGASLYVGHPAVPSLQPASVTVPVHVMAHELDGCPDASPAASAALHQAFAAAGVDSEFDLIKGGFDQTDNLNVFVCDSRTHHGFLGVENKAVKRVAQRMDRILKDLHHGHKGNSRPVAVLGSMVAGPAAPATIDLAALAGDPDGDALTYSLPHPISSRGAPISISGSVVTVSPLAGGITDGFVFVVEDGKGGKAAGAVTVLAGP